jgi:hypothetical protein
MIHAVCRNVTHEFKDEERLEKCNVGELGEQKGVGDHPITSYCVYIVIC